MNVWKALAAGFPFESWFGVLSLCADRLQLMSLNGACMCVSELEPMYRGA